MKTSFEANFERYNVKKDGTAVLELSVSAVELAQVVHVLAAVEIGVRVEVFVIENKSEKFIVEDAVFEKLDVYREGNSRIKFIMKSDEVSLDGLNKFVAKM